jgi:hypothetical protein
MAYRIRQRRAVPVPVDFPQLCPSSTPTTVLNYSKLSFEEEVPELPKKGIDHGWIRLYFHHGQVMQETDYIHPEPSLNELAGKAILKMKKRWIKFYTDRGLEPYDYDYIPPEDEPYDTESSSSWSAEDPEEFSD